MFSAEARPGPNATRENGSSWKTWVSREAIVGLSAGTAGRTVIRDIVRSYEMKKSE